MPQGGIDGSEEPSAAAMRELAEETGTDKAEIIGQSSDWLTYTFPPELIGIVLKGRYRGQKQRWFAMRFLGTDSDFNIHASAGGHPPEFDDWRWASSGEVVESIVPFKRDVYNAVMHEFRTLLK
jgi:putative (di)nucleoside polyphosphate hydrolase